MEGPQDLERKGISIVSWNVHGWRDGENRLNRRRITETLKNLNADVIALQEVKNPFPQSLSETKESEMTDGIL